MRKISALLILFLLIFSFNLNQAKAEVFKDLLIGTEENSLYSYRLGSLLVGDGDNLYVKILADKIAYFNLELVSPKNKLILSTQMLTNKTEKIYFFNNGEYGYYRIILKDNANNIYAQASIKYIQKQININNFIYNFTTTSNSFYIQTNGILPNDLIYKNVSFYLALITNSSLLNFTNQLVSEIISDVEGSRPVRLGFSVIKQEIDDNNLIIMPLIFNSTLGYVQLEANELNIKLYYQNVFNKLINGTKILTVSPAHIIKYSIKNFKIGKDKIKIPLPYILNNNIFFLNITYSKEENSLLYSYNTHFIYISNKLYQVIKEVKINKNETKSQIILDGSLEVDFSKFFEFNSTHALKNLFIGIIIKEEELFRDILLKKFNYKILGIKLYNLVKKSFIEGFNIEVNNSYSYSIYDKAILIYQILPDIIFINLKNVRLPLKYLYNKTLNDFDVNIIQYKFYNLSLTIVAEGMEKANATLNIYYNQLLVYSSKVMDGYLNLVLPEGNYTIKVYKEGFTNSTQSFYLNSNKEIFITLYRQRYQLSDTDYVYIYGLAFVLFLQVLLNLYIYRKLKKI